MAGRPTQPVHDRTRMIRQMAPERRPGRWVFCTCPPEPALREAALASLREPEGLSLVLPLEVARARGLAENAPVMAHILLRVHSALDGVGLTAAVAETLAAAEIACNVVAGHHHDHLLVPEARAEAALQLLKARAAQEETPK